MATITVFEAGYCTHPGCIALRGAGFATCRFPARCYLIQTRGRCWLWDTGYASHFMDCTRHGIFMLYRKVTPVYFDASEAIAAQLACIGVRPSDLEGIVISHFHGDHMAGLRDFPQTSLICSGEGWRAMRKLRGMAALRRGFVPGLIPDDFDARRVFVETFPPVALSAELAPFEHAYALPDAAGEVLIVALPGHAAGHLGAFVATDNGWMLLASDAAWSPASYHELRGPSRLVHFIMDNSRAYYATLNKLHQLDASGHVQIMLTHEGAP